MDMELKNSKLLACPNYFISWMKDCNIDPKLPKQDFAKIMKVMVTAVYDVIGSPFDLPDHGDEKDAADHNLTEKQEIEAEHMMIFQKTMGPLIEAFVRLRAGEFEIAKRNMDWVESRLKQFQDIEMLKEYVRGYEFLLTLLKCHNDILQNVTDAEKNTEVAIKKFQDFSNKEKSIVLMARWMLEESLRYENCVPAEQSIQHLIEVSQLDPNCWVWQYVLCNRLRNYRRSNQDMKPSLDEITAITLSAKYAPEAYVRVCIAGVCQCLAEIIKWNSYRNRHQNDHGPIHLGHMTFQNATFAVDHIKERTSHLIEDTIKSDEPLPIACFAEFIRFGEIFSTILPPAYRDYEMAHKCLRFALKVIPNNSKANHKMGIIQLIGFQNIEKAVEFLGKAVDLQIGNFPALIDLIKTLLSSLQEYDEKLEETFSHAYKHCKLWSEKQIMDLKFLEGCYYFLKNEIQKAVECWILVIQDPYPPQGFAPISFNGLSGIAVRHNWSRKTIAGLSKETILEGIESLMDLGKGGVQLLSRIEEEMKGRPISQSNRFDCGDMRRSISDAQNIPGRQNQRQQRFTVTPTEADKGNYWRQNLSTSPGADTTSTQRSYPPPRQIFIRGDTSSAQSSYPPQNQRFRVTPVPLPMQGRNSNRNQHESPSKNRSKSPDNWRS